MIALKPCRFCGETEHLRVLPGYEDDWPITGAELKRGPTGAFVIEANLGKFTPGKAPTSVPLVEWMNPADCLIEGRYQRDLSDKSTNLIRKIVEGWDWRRFKPPIVAWTERGFEIIDGQHTAIAAAAHPDIDKIPVLVVEAAQMQDRATAFIPAWEALGRIWFKKCRKRKTS